jgi:hypothetical protein
MSKQIPLASGHVVLVDDEDYDRVSALRWFRLKNGKNDYAGRWAVRGKRLLLMHRFILDVDGDPSVLIDHANGNGLDNQRANLRHASRSQNGANGGKRLIYARRPTTSKYKGVSYQQGFRKCVARITVSGRSRYLGSFTNEEDAAAAYNRAALDAFGPFAYINDL